MEYKYFHLIYWLLTYCIRLNALLVFYYSFILYIYPNKKYYSWVNQNILSFIWTILSNNSFKKKLSSKELTIFLHTKWMKGQTPEQSVVHLRQHTAPFPGNASVVRFRLGDSIDVYKSIFQVDSVSCVYTTVGWGPCPLWSLLSCIELDIDILRVESDSAQVIKAINSAAIPTELYGVVSYSLSLVVGFQFVFCMDLSWEEPYGR